MSGNPERAPVVPTQTGTANSWQVIGRSVRGASHVRSGQLNQDAIGWEPQSGVGPPLVVTIADGHGSAKSWRSDQGSQFAVATANRLLDDFLRGQQTDLPPEQRLTAAKRVAEERLARAIVVQWARQVQAHLAAQPLTETELAALGAKDGPKARAAVEANPLLVYGATLLAALVTDDYLLVLQLGDGDILTISDTGEVVRPLPPDERLFANETTSLASPEAWQDVRVSFQVLAGTPPALVLLATDGYGNSYRDDAGFLRAGADYLDLIRADGLDAVAAGLEGWLVQASTEGSGDDVTVAILARDGIGTPTVPSVPEFAERDSTRTSPLDPEDDAAWMREAPPSPPVAADGDRVFGLVVAAVIVLTAVELGTYALDLDSDLHVPILVLLLAIKLAAIGAYVSGRHRAGRAPTTAAIGAVALGAIAASIAALLIGDAVRGTGDNAPTATPALGPASGPSSLPVLEGATPVIAGLRSASLEHRPVRHR